MSRLIIFPLLLFFLSTLPLAKGLEPENVFVIYNKTMRESKEVAEHYCARRKVPKENLIPLELPKQESISREIFDDQIREPLRKALQNHKEKVRVLLTVYGVPLRVGGDRPSENERKQLVKLRQASKDKKKQLEELKATILELEKKKKQKPTPKNDKLLRDARDKRQELTKNLRLSRFKERWLSHAESVACVDSELTLLWWEKYELRRWITNPLYFRYPRVRREGLPPVLMVSRLDGPSPVIAKRLVDDAIEVEKTGLKGKVYVDARGIRLNSKTDPRGTGYGGYDESLREMATLLKEKAKLPVILDNKGPLFKPQSCPDTALYCGWYSLARYVDCCQFNKGAVAYHIASSEARSLRNAKATFWCPQLLQKGVAATMGPVAEPYTIGFPKPEEFFGFLVTGEYTLVECYSRSMLLTSWMTVLVGDPLYNPYAGRGRLLPSDVHPSPNLNRGK